MAVRLKKSTDKKLWQMIKIYTLSIHLYQHDMNTAKCHVM